MRFAEPRKNAFRKESVKGGLPPKECRRKAEKGFNWIVRGCVFGALIQGLQNLETSCERNVFGSFCARQKEPKSTPEVCEPLDSGDDSKLCRKRLRKNFRRLMPKPVLPAKRRRKGFESVRKDSCRADARLFFFEKELLCCKLTVASDIRKGLLHVSFGVVGSCCHGALRKSFFYRIALHELKNCSFPQNKSFPFTESFTLCSQKHLVFATKTPLI